MKEYKAPCQKSEVQQLKTLVLRNSKNIWKEKGTRSSPPARRKVYPITIQRPIQSNGPTSNQHKMQRNLRFQSKGQRDGSPRIKDAEKTSRKSPRDSIEPAPQGLSKRRKRCHLPLQFKKARFVSG